MNFFRQFEKFNPVSSEIPGHLFDQLPEVATRARALLKSRTAGQMEEVAKKIDWAICEYFRDLEKNTKTDSHDSELRDGMYQNGTLGDEYFDIKSIRYNEVSVLKKCLDRWDDIGGENFPNAKLYEFFAVLSFWMLADAEIWSDQFFRTYKQYSLRDLQTQIAEDESNLFVETYLISVHAAMSMASDHALKAMEAICYAEHLFEVERLHDDDLKKESDRKKAETIRRSMKAEEMNIERHRENYAVQEMVLIEWEKCKLNYKSADDAGKKLSNWLMDKEIERGPRTISTWIKDRIKQSGRRP